MNNTPNPKIRELAAELKLAYIKQNWHELASDNSMTHEEYLLDLLTGEYENRLKNGISRRLKEAKFPIKKNCVTLTGQNTVRNFFRSSMSLKPLILSAKMKT